MPLRPFLVAGILLYSALLQAGEVTVAVAANFTPVMRELATAFEAGEKHTVVIASGSSGRLYAQIVNGAPFHVFFSADQDKPAALVKDGLADAETRFTYARGTLVLWSADPEMKVENAQALRDPRYNRVAMANPRLAPYGHAAAQVLDNLERQGINVAFRVMGENITQAYQFTETGNVPVGFVALSQVIEHGVIHRGAGWIVPAEMHDPIRQDAVLLNRGREHEAAIAFLEFMKSEQAKTIINSFGYGPD